MSFNDWASGLLDDPRIDAPLTLTNLATLAGWTTHEKGSLANWSQWCNPFNTTEPWAGSVTMNPPARVQGYRSLQDGHDATVITLIWEPNGTGAAYSAIVRNLRKSLPARFWSDDARSQLDTWGTGASWLDSVPLQGDSPMEAVINQAAEIVNRVYAMISGPGNYGADFATKYKSYLGQVWNRFGNIDKAIADARSAILTAVGQIPAGQPIDPAVAADIHTLAGMAPDVHTIAAMEPDIHTIADAIRKLQS